MKGRIFSIEEFAVYDGEGIRVNVFFKGCPLRCQWCHNPEGWSSDFQIVKNPNLCVDCGACKAQCLSPDNCNQCGKCIIICPRGARRESGRWYEAKELASKLKRYQKILEQSGGGLTFSGGEVLMQPDFLLELLQECAFSHRTLETSGFGDPQKWKRILKEADFVFYDLKIMDSQKHKVYTGVPNEIILQNALSLMGSGVPFTVRAPFIHGVNTDAQNLQALAKFLQGAENLKQVELLAYNKLAGAKYKLLEQEYLYEFEQPSEEDYALAAQIFSQYGIPHIVSK